MDRAQLSGFSYRLCITGHISTDWFDWPYQVEITPTFDQAGQRAITLIRASIPDQPALYSLLEKLRDLNVTLIFIYRVEPDFASIQAG